MRPRAEAFAWSPTAHSREWTPARYVPRGIACDFCRFPIPHGSPGHSKGDRGTKAWYCARLRVWECMPCRSEAMRAEAAWEDNRLNLGR